MSSPSWELLAAEVSRLGALVAGQAVLIESLRAENALLVAENAELRARLGQTPRNSSVPPSSEGLAKPAPKSRRTRSGRKPGGQPGHPGSTLRQVTDPDVVIRHEPVACGGCGSSLAEAAQTGVVRRQVFDLPPIVVQVTEHQLVERRCPCGARTRGQAPADVAAPVSYGPVITAIIVYLYVGQFLSRQRTADALGELFGVPVSAGTVASATARAAQAVTDSGVLEVIRTGLVASPVVHFDETGFRVAGKLHWVHSASTDRLSLLTCHARRGVEAMNDAGVLPRFTGTAVHDAWAPYDTYSQATHALCGAHVLRELTAVTDTHQGQDSDGFCWANQAADAFLACCQLVDAALDAGHDAPDQVALATATRLLKAAATIGVTDNTGRPGKIAAKHRALARRLLKRQDDYLRFTTDFTVPFDNNAAEREIRMIKIRQKVSGCLRTLTGAEQFSAIRSYLATARKNGTHFFQALTMLGEGKTWLPAT